MRKKKISVVCQTMSSSIEYLWPKLIDCSTFPPSINVVPMKRSVSRFHRPKMGLSTVRTFITTRRIRESVCVALFTTRTTVSTVHDKKTEKSPQVFSFSDDRPTVLEKKFRKEEKDKKRERTVRKHGSRSEVSNRQWMRHH